MEEIYENILLDKSHWDDDNQCFIFRSDDVNNGLKNLGYKEYVLEETVDDLTKEINKRILDKILKR